MKGSNSINESLDPDGLASSRAVDHVLHFSNKLRGNRKESYFYAPVPPGPAPPKSVLLDPAKPTNIVGQPHDTVYIDPAGTYASQWAEVGYYLVQTGTTTIPEPGSSTPLASLPGTPLYALYRCVYVGVPSNVFVNNSEAAASIANYGGISCSTTGGNVYFNTPNDWALASDASPVSTGEHRRGTRSGVARPGECRVIPGAGIQVVNWPVRRHQRVRQHWNQSRLHAPRRPDHNPSL
ncbi:MAG: hypothetical protein U0744_03450 [Gemmataceae bacterium]